MTLFDVECAQGVSRGWLPKYAARGQSTNRNVFEQQYVEFSAKCQFKYVKK